MSGEGDHLNAKTPNNPSSIPPPLASQSNPATNHALLTAKPKVVSNLALYCTKLPEPTVNSICGALGGVASGIVTCPLDVIKTRLQAQGSFRRAGRRPTPVLYFGMIGTAKTIWKEDGVRGMYRGLGPMLLGYLPTWAVYMSVYDMSKDYYGTHLPSEHKWMINIWASITAGACSTLATNPIWVIKTRLMSQVGNSAPHEAQTPWRYKGTWDAARSMYRAEGLRAFYSGLAPALLGLTHVAIQFPLYEYFKKRFTGLGMGENTSKSDHENHWIGILSATFLSKICATSATYPHEVLRTRLQTQQRSIPTHSDGEVSFRGGMGHHHHTPMAGGTSSDGMINLPKYRGMIRTIKTILAEEGWRAFYSGMGTNMVRAVPAAMTTMLTYETMKTNIHRLQEEGREHLNGV